MDALPSVTRTLDLFPLLSGLFGGLALFLLGMDFLAKALQAAAGGKMKTLLARFTSNRFLAAISGAVVTGILNSSSITTVLVVGFVTAGLMSLQQAIGVIMGANIGSTVTAQIIAFDVGRYALLLVAVGFFMNFTGRRDTVREYGRMILGLGMVFYGMGVMGDGMAPLRSYAPFLSWMEGMNHPVPGILVGALFTGLVQSSAATVGIAVVLAGSGLLSLEAGIALAFGANIGTCVTAVLAALGKPPAAKRAALAHVLFNVLGVAVWVGLIPYLAEIVREISPSHPELSGAERSAAEVPRQIANANTLFNVFNTLLFIGFAGVLARLVEWIIPERPKDARIIIKPLYLDDELASSPALALQRVRLELGHMGGILEEMYASLPDALRSTDPKGRERLAIADDKIDILSDAVLAYLARIRGVPLSDEESRAFVGLMTAAEVMSGIGDVMEQDLTDAVARLRALGVRPSETMDALMRRLHEAVGGALASGVRAITERDETAAQDVLARKHEVARCIEAALAHHASKLDASSKQDRTAVFRAEMALVDGLKRLYSLTKRLARVTYPKAAAAEAATSGD